ncbi:ribonuclease R [Rhizobiales bacterium]|uniref:ribonuclease R n=1 Tax=Hongsoonwoonella zoysiae TaxID=2821844 RepID=UPI0015608AE9|nr:ribonuclease R [Hongsoonwoonella zoysiae]NRG19168.1 ribonuclease R [Hongsoonwoonella zoysiae]
MTRGGPAKAKKRKKTDKGGDELPSREDILAFVASQPGKVGKREIAKHFAIKGGQRIFLKRLLNDLAEEGVLEKRQKRLMRPGDLPPVLVVNLIARDADGELLGEPMKWDEEENGKPPKILILPERHKKPGPAGGIGDQALVRLSDVDPGREAKHSARIIKLLERRQTTVLGILRLHSGRAGARLEPVERKQKELQVDTSDLKGAEDGDLVTVQITRTSRFGLPQARITRRIGSMNSEMAVSEIALHTHGIPHDFPATVLAEAESAEPVKPGEREDWRDLPLVTIDPPDAKDHDDAVHAVADDAPDNEGGHIVTVAIADVAAYVRPGSALDREAHIRGNSVYFPDRVIPMLPERISNDLCSLRELEDRPAMAVRMVFDKAGKKRSHSFHRILMRSQAKLSYVQAQAAIDGQTDEKTEVLLDGVLKPLWDAYAVLKKGRDDREPLDLDLPERIIRLDEKGMVAAIYVPERLDAHKLIEEFMIQANVAAAETLEKRQTPLLYRIHDASSPEKLEALKDFLATLDIKLSQRGGLRPSVFNGILKKVQGTPNDQLVNEVILRSQAQAEYAPANIGHFGLNLRRYAHFTSPIRRYADLIVHRGLIRALDLGNDGLPEGIESKLEAIGAEVSAAERRAMLAERETIDRLIAIWMKDQVGATFNGRISGVVKSGLFVRLDNTGADGFVPASTIGEDYYHYDETSHSMIGRSTGETYRLGDHVEVRLVEAAPFAGALRFELLSEGRYLTKRSAFKRPQTRSGRVRDAAQKAPGRQKKGRRR